MSGWQRFSTIEEKKREAERIRHRDRWMIPVLVAVNFALVVLIVLVWL